MPSADLLERVALPPSPVEAGSDRPGRGTGALGRGLITPLLGLVGLGAWLAAVTRADPSTMTAAGLSSVLGWPYAVGLVAVVAAITVELATRARDAALALLVLCLVIVLFGTASAVEPVARLPDSWIIAGFVRYIAGHGHILHFDDARFYWPGMFSLAALVDAAMGIRGATSLIGWAPLGFELLYLPALRLIGRSVSPSRRVAWLGAVLFYVGNWVEQDYFSPQALNVIFLLVVVGIALYGWEPAPRTGSRLPALRPGAPRHSARSSTRRRRRLSDCLGVPTHGPATTTVLSLLMAVLIAASVVSHQLTPPAIFLALLALAAARRLPSFQLVVLLPVLMLGWVAFGATQFWQYGHTALILGGIGHLGTSLSSGVSSRVTGTPLHRAITDLRILIAVAMLGAAAVGAVVRRTRARDLELLVIAPFAILALQSYGGEATLRTYLYGLPFASLLAAEAACAVAGWAPGWLRPRPAGDDDDDRPDSLAARWGRRHPRLLAALTRVAGRPAGWRWPRVVAVGMLLVIAAGLLTFVRGGNDAYVAATPADRQTVLRLYHAARPGEVLGELEPYVPWMDQGNGTWHFVTMPPAVVDGRVHRFALSGVDPEWIILTTGELRYGEIVNGWPAGWESQAKQQLVASGSYRVTWSSGADALLEIRPGHLHLTPAERRALAKLRRLGLLKK